MNQSWPTASFLMAHKLRMAFMFTNDYILHNALNFASWPTNVKIFPIWSFKEKLTDFSKRRQAFKDEDKC